MLRGSFLLGSLLFLQAVKSWSWPCTKSEGQEEKPGEGTVSTAGWHMGGGQSQERSLEKYKGQVGHSAKDRNKD